MRKNLFGSFIPTIAMIIIAVISYFFKFKDLLIIGVVLIIPLTFFTEGIICSKKRIGIILPVVLSLAIFLIIDKIMLFMGDDGLAPKWRLDKHIGRTILLKLN